MPGVATTEALDVEVGGVCLLVSAVVAIGALEVAVGDVCPPVLAVIATGATGSWRWAGLW